MSMKRVLIAFAGAAVVAVAAFGVTFGLDLNRGGSEIQAQGIGSDMQNRLEQVIKVLRDGSSGQATGARSSTMGWRFSMVASGRSLLEACHRPRTHTRR